MGTSGIIQGVVSTVDHQDYHLWLHCIAIPRRLSRQRHADFLVRSDTSAPITLWVHSRFKCSYPWQCHQYLRRGLFDFSQIWYRVWSHDIGCNTNVQGQASKIKVTAWKRRLIAKLLLPFRKYGLLNLMVMLEVWSDAGTYQFVRIRNVNLAKNNSMERLA